ncbi:Calcium-dependent protease precursor [Posidoniimonas polymericola]|uniref:Calcium-dependent protease n=1 Tax=Posidoniimonas polymericola TaxID=2528002 RepID=A0A5C5YQ52_9BACT|nr:S8 family serine peptidase [Posidoniimonas polymericola]TWT76918.1 Calcium-dependent protease precursor [Posidoniimonas polymericola]
MTINRRIGLQASSKLISAPTKGRAKNWNFERLEDRHLMTGDPVVDPYAALGVSESEMASIAEAVAAASSASGVLPNDPYLGYQWHLINTGQIVGDGVEQDIYGVPGQDLNVAGAWALGYTGKGVTVAVVDSGVQLDHPDLAANISPTLRYNALFDYEAGELPPFSALPPAGGPDLFVPGDAHGTAVAGIIAAVGNNGIGGAGIAYDATIVPITLITELYPNAPEDVVRAIYYGNDQIDIYNHSWGYSPGTRTAFGAPGTFGPFDPVLAALRTSATEGRGGLGAIHVFSSGNDAAPSFTSPLFVDVGIWDYAGYDGLSNSRFTIAVTGVDHDGQYNNVDGTYTAYPEASPSVLVAGPTGSNVQEIGGSLTVGSGIWTTDIYNPNFDITSPVFDPDSILFNPDVIKEGFNGPTVGLQEPYDLIFDRFADPSYTSKMNGTSAAAPMVSGVIALMLEANPNLSYRDVQNILVRSARQNAQFEDLGDGLFSGTYGVTINNTWITNRNEFFHTPDSTDGLVYLQDGTINYLELFDDSRTDTGRDFIDSSVGSALTVAYNPVIDPDYITLGSATDPSPVILTNMMDPSMFANGAGFTVSLGRGQYGTAVGYGHGTVDAELAVKLASQWTEYLDDELTWSTGKQQPADQPIGFEEIGSQASGYLVVPGRLDSSLQTTAIDPAFSETPAFPDGNTFSFGADFLPIIVPETLTTDPSQGFNSNMVVEWVELRLSSVFGSVDDMRITLVSPDGTQSELTNYFDLDSGSRGYQFNIASNLVGVPLGGDLSQEATFSTNRHWGERSDNTVAIDPSTGEPYPGAPERSWQVHFESFGLADSIIDYEVIFHGSPLDPATQRIQGFVGVDEFREDLRDADGDGDTSEVIQDGLFNFDRWVQVQQDIYNPTNITPTNDDRLDNATFSRLNIPYINSGNGTTALIQVEDPLNPGEFIPQLVGIASESLGNGGIEFNRLGEVERELDFTQEAFAENVTVQLFREIADGSGGSSVESTPYKSFITGDDGNYYFDVVPPTDEGDAGTGDVIAYVIKVVDGEGRTVLDTDANVPVPDLADPEPTYFMPKYQGEWRVTDDYFYAWDHQGRSPEFVTAENPLSGFEENVLSIVDTFSYESALFDASGNALTAMVSGLGSAGQEITFFDETGLDVAAYTGTTPELVDANGDAAVILNWDPTPTGQNASQFILLATDPTDPNGGLTVLDPDGEIEYTLDGMTGEITGTPLDPEDEPVTIQINGNWSHRVTDADGGVTDVNALLEIYDQFGQLVTVEQDLGGNYFFVSASNIRTDVVFTPQMDTYDLEVADFGAFTSPIYAFDPTTMYDVLTDEFGTPLLYQGGSVEDDVRGINFLLSSGSSATFAGQVYTDANSDLVYSPAAGDVAKEGVLVWADLNNDGSFQFSTEPFAMTDANGNYAIDMSGLAAPEFVRFRVADQPGFTVVSPDGGSYLEYTSPTNLTGESFDFVFEVGDGDPTGDGPASVTGLVFHDSNQNGVKENTEFGVAGVTVYVDANGNGALDDGERRTTTNGGGVYELSIQTAGTVLIAVDVTSPFVQTAPFNDANGNGTLDPGEGSRTVVVQNGVVSSGIGFGVVSLAGRDFGDLANYPTLAAEGGAWHQVIAGVHLGDAVDGEIDGQPTAAADGDDNDDTVNDEDGVVPRFGGDGVISDGEEFGFTIKTAGVGYFLNAWIDFNNDGDWDDPGEHVYDDIDLNPGTWVAGVTLDSDGEIGLPTITAPDVAEGAPLAARFRWGVGGLNYSGAATIGEVEDYVFQASTEALFVLEGDFDSNGVVDLDDKQLWRSTYGATGSNLAADGNRDGRVDSADYSLWRENYVPKGDPIDIGTNSTELVGKVYHQVPFSPEQLAIMGVEVEMQKIGAGVNARWVPVYRVLQTAPVSDPVAAGDTSNPASPVVTVDTVVDTVVDSVVDTGVNTWVAQSSARPVQAPQFLSRSATVADPVAAAVDASELDLFFAELDDESGDDEELLFTSFESEDITEEELALALQSDDSEEV